MIQEESSQCTEGMSLVALRFAVEYGARMVLAGDHRQLPPVVKSQEAKRSGMALSMHRRIMTNVGGDDRLVVMLIEHYRCHPQLMYVFNRFFYEGKLICRVYPDDRPPLAGFPATPIPTRPDLIADDEDCPEWGGLNSDKATGAKAGDVHRITLIHVNADEVSTASGGRANLKEAEVVVELVRRIAPACMEQGYSVQVSTPYRVHTGLLEVGAPAHPGDLPKKDELRARAYYGKKTDKRLTSLPDGTVFTSTEGPPPARV